MRSRKGRIVIGFMKNLVVDDLLVLYSNFFANQHYRRRSA